MRQESIFAKFFVWTFLCEHSYVNNLATTASRIRKHGNGRSLLEAKVAPYSFQSHVNGFKTSGHLVELRKLQCNVLRDLQSRGWAFRCRSPSFKPSGFKMIGFYVGVVAAIRSKLDQIGKQRFGWRRCRDQTKLHLKKLLESGMPK